MKLYDFPMEIQGIIRKIIITKPNKKLKLFEFNEKKYCTIVNETFSNIYLHFWLRQSMGFPYFSLKFRYEGHVRSEEPFFTSSFPKWSTFIKSPGVKTIMWSQGDK